MSAIKGIEGAKTFDSIMYALSDVKWIKNISKIVPKLQEIPQALSTMFNRMSVASAFGATPFQSLTAGLSALSGTILPLIAATAGISALAVALHSVMAAGDNANNKMTESAEQYATAQSDLENINQQLDETKSKINELNAKKSLTFVEKGQLDDLRATTEELKVQQKLKEKEITRTAKQTANDAYDAYKKNYAGYGKIDEESVSKAKNDASMYANDNEDYYLSNEKDISQLIAGLQEYREKSADALKANKTDEKEYYDQMASDAEDSIMSQIGQLQEYKSNLEEIPESQLTLKQKNALQDISDSIEYAWKQVDENEWNQMQLDKLFDDVDMNDAKSELVDLAKSTKNVGITADQVKSKYPELVSEVEDAGFTIDDLVNNINSEAGVQSLDNIKQQLKDIEDIEIDGDYSKKIKDDWDSFIDGLSNDEIEIMYSIKDSEGSDEWSIDEWKKQIKEASDTVQKDNSETFASIMGDTEDDSLSKSIDDFQEKTSTINTALQTLQEGGKLSSSDISDLIQQFPQLANETDNLGSALAGLNADNLSSMLSSIDEQMDKVTSDSDKKAFQSLKDQLIDSVDLSGVDKSKVTDGLRKLFEGNANDAVTRSLAKDQIANINKAFADELKTAEGKEIIYKLSLKPEASNWDLSEWQSQFDEELAKTSKNTLEKYVTQATNDLSALQTATSEASSTTGLTKSSIDSISQMFSGIPNFDADALFRNTADGVKLNTKALSSLLSVQHDIKAAEFAKDIQKQTEAIKKQNDAVQEAKGTADFDTQQTKLKDMLASLADMQQAQSQYHALYKQQQELFSDYGQWQQAQSTANAGDKYNNMVSGLQAAKDAWDKGLVGTDDFKSFAKMISPSGATDDVNFAENYAKAARYLTEDESGVKAFLNDLSSKGLADFNEESQQWSYNVKDMAEAAKQMGMGKDFMSNMFGRLEDYGFHNNVISDAEDGVLKLSDAYSNLAESEARLEDLKKNDPTNTTAIEQAEKEVSGYKQDIDELGTNLKEVASHTAENYNRELETAKNQMKTLADERERILKSNEYGDNTQAVADYMQSQIDQLGQNYGLDSSALQQQAEQAAKAYSDALQNATIENPVTPDFGEDTASADAYASAVDKVQQANKDNNQTLSDSIKTLQQYNSEQIKGIDLLDGAYDSDELKPAEQALDNICQSLGLTSEEAGLLGQVLESMGIIKPEVDDSEVKQAKTDAEETKQTYDNLGDSTVSINADVSGEDSVASFIDQCSSIQQGMTTSLTDLSAYAGGRVSLPKDEKALVNEVGTESIVRDGQWSLIPGGAHLTNLKKGDIIFSASQTEDLLRNGATPGHARAYAQGSLSDISLAHAFGGGSGWGGFGGGLSNKTSVSSSGGSSSQQSYNANSGAVARNTDETEKNTKAKSDSTETFNWVETKLKKFSEAVEHISNQITDYISSTFKTVLLKRQVKAVEKQLKANEQGYTAYMNKANSIDISDDYKNKVINGTFSIEEIDTSSDSGKQLAKDIKSFQTYYNSAQDCKDTVQELNNKLLELYETIVNMPTEKAEKKIDRLKTKLESLNAVSDTVSLGESAIAAMQNQIKVNIPGLGNAQKKLDKAETARNATKKTRAKASKTLKSATADAESTGNTLVKESEKQTKSIGKKLKSAAKSSTNKATYNAIAQAIREGKPVNLKGLKGSALKYAKSYNSSLKQGNSIASKVKAGKTVKTSGMSNILKSTAQAYNTDAKEKASAQKVYDNAKKADEKALNDLTKAQKNKDKLYAGSTKEQQILATTKGKKSYVYQNMLLTQETKNLKQQNEQRQKALKETRDSYMKAKSKYDTADTDKTKSQNKLLNNKTVMSKLNKTQQKALKAGKTVSTKGITDPKVLKWIQDYNEKVKKSTDLSKKLRIEQEALDKATSEAAQSQAEYAQSIVENAKKKLENIANYYDSFTSQWENRNSMYEAYMDRMQTQGYNLSTKFYEAEIGQQQKIVDNLSQKYIAMKRNFAQAVQDGTIVEGTEEYYEMQNEIDQVAISLKEAQNKVVEFQASIRDLKWEQFDQLQDAIGRITSESDFLIDLMSHKDMYDKDGNMTEQGLATMGLHGVNYNTYMAQADKYKEEMLKISEELANDPNNQKLIDRKNELIDAQQQAILSAEDEKDSIKDLIQDGIDKQLDALDDLIDKYLDCLDSEKDLYEYRKKIGEQSEKIASLQKQLSSLQGDNSEENKAKLQKLKEDLKSAQDDMEETQYDKYISDQKKLLDELKQDYKKALDDRMDNVDALISDAIASINSNSSNISQTLQTESKNVGYTLSGEMQTIWTSQSGVISQYGDDFSSKLTGVNSAIENVYNRQKDMIDAINAMAEKWIAKADQMLQQPTKTEGVLEEVEQKPDKDNVAEGNPTPDPPKVSDDESIRDAVLVDPDEPKKKPNKNDNKKTGNGKAEVGDKVTYVSGRYYGDSDGGHGSGNYYLGKKVKITRINKGSKYPYAIDATDGTELGWVKLNQLKGYASGIMRVPNDQLAWTQEQGEEAIVRNDGSILTPLSRDVSVLNADMTKNLWDFMGNPGSFLSDYSDGEKFGVKNVDNSSSVDVGGVTIQCNMPNVQNANDLLHELTTNKDIEKAICAMTIGRAMGGSSLAKYKYRV